ncbi:hypothetical protein ACOHYD_04660 [Desulfobacterota bacterium M19]
MAKSADKAGRNNGNDIGEDWGEAFAEDDEMFSPDGEGSSPFFLEDEQEKLPDETGKNQGGGKNGRSASPAGSLPRGAVNGAFKKIVSLPRPFKIALAGVLLLMFFLLIFFLRPAAEPHKPAVSLPAVQPTPRRQSAAGAPIIKHGGQLNQLKPVPVVPVVKKQIPQAAPPVVKPAKGTDSVLAAGSRSRKWPLKSFFVAIPAANHTSVVLTVDLTLFLQNSGKTVLPLSRKVFIRDLIYQFFRNQSLADLKHFTLARGILKRRLMAWIKKQWPGLPVSSISFDRYQLL